MTTFKEAKGRCLCGSVQVEAQAMSQDAGACHCSMCRKWGGGPYMEVNCGSEVAFKGEEYISIFNSSEWAERGFCKQCGTHLFYRLKGNQQHMMPIGLFDDDVGLVFKQQVFIDDKPSYYCFSNETNNMTGAEIFAKFSASSK